MRDLRTIGTSVPRDVSVVGFDGIELGQYIDPPLTTAKQPSARIGSEALELLVGLLAARAVTVPAFVLPGSVSIARSPAANPGTTGPPRRG